MTKPLNWKAHAQRRKARQEAEQIPPRLPPDETREAKALYHYTRFRQSGERGYSVRGAQGHDAHARRNYTKVTLPRVKWLEGDDAKKD